jgi:hypothetical protein
MTLQEWKDFTVSETLGTTLSHADPGHQTPTDAARKCPHGQYSVLYCVFCGDLRYEPNYKVLSETPVERKEIICARCGAKERKCDCKRHRRYKFVGDDEWGENFEVRPNRNDTPVPFQAQMLGPEIPPGRPWQAGYREIHFKIAFLYRVRFSVSWRSLLHFKVVKFPSKCAKQDCKYPLSHGHPTLKTVYGRSRSGFGSFVDNPVVPHVRKGAVTANEIVTRWCREMQSQPFEPWSEKMYSMPRVRTNQRWVTHNLFPRRIESPYLREWAAEYWMHPTVSILNRRVPVLEWPQTWRIGSRPKAGRPMNLSKRSLRKGRDWLKVRDAARLWNVSERTARRRLAEMRNKPYEPVAPFARRNVG